MSSSVRGRDGGGDTSDSGCGRGGGGETGGSGCGGGEGLVGNRFWKAGIGDCVLAESVESSSELPYPESDCRSSADRDMIDIQSPLSDSNSGIGGVALTSLRICGTVEGKVRPSSRAFNVAPELLTQVSTQQELFQAVHSSGYSVALK